LDEHFDHLKSAEVGSKKRNLKTPNDEKKFVLFSLKYFKFRLRGFLIFKKTMAVELATRANFRFFNFLEQRAL
jgi:hypothetical protein